MLTLETHIRVECVYYNDKNTDQFLSDAVHCSSLQSVARMTDERCSAAVSPLSSCCSCSTNLGIPCHHVTHLGGATIITTHQYLNVTNILLNMLPSKRIERGYRIAVSL